MDARTIRDYCLTKPGAWPDWPWGGGPDADHGNSLPSDEAHPVIKVDDGRGGGRIFAFLGSDGVGLKGGATREIADEWLDRYPDHARVMPYRGSSGWNTLLLEGAIPDEELFEAVDESYRLVVGRLPR